MTREEIWLSNFDPTDGGEVKKSRPCVVVSPVEIRGELRTVIVAPMTMKSRPAPFQIEMVSDWRGVI